MRSASTQSATRILPPPKAEALLEGFCPEPCPDDQIAVNSNGRLLLLHLTDIDWLEAADGCVVVHVGPETYRLQATLASLAAKLPPGRFQRASPTMLVNAERLKKLQELMRDECRVLFGNGLQLNLRRSLSEPLR